ncbi:MAG: hypothetical protein LBU20_00960 [Candidatus Nomurabacteria bacterium]|jgi:hypothetical protein|nr:hypothetical protein [Candidatus Nomurabacteria bacterium]
MEKAAFTPVEIVQNQVRRQLETIGTTCAFLEDDDVERRGIFIRQYVENHPTIIGETFGKSPRAAIYVKPDLISVDNIPIDEYRKFIIKDRLALALIKKMQQVCGELELIDKSSDTDLDGVCQTFESLTNQQPQFILDQSDGWDEELALAFNGLICARSPYYHLTMGVDSFYNGGWPRKDVLGRPLEESRNLNTLSLKPLTDQWDFTD